MYEKQSQHLSFDQSRPISPALTPPLPKGAKVVFSEKWSVA
jgi:hypothetical protein